MPLRSKNKKLAIKNKNKKEIKIKRKKARNDFEKPKKHPYPSHRSKAIYVKVHIFSPFVQYDFSFSSLNDPFKSL
jgi:hypothetical protein